MGLRWVVTLLCAFYLAEAAGGIRLALSHPLYAVIALCFWLPLAIGLWLMNRIARMVALVIHWMLFVLIPFGLLNPFADMDHTFGRVPPPLWLLLTVVLALGTLNCLALFYLLKFKEQFHARARSAP